MNNQQSFDINGYPPSSPSEEQRMDFSKPPEFYEGEEIKGEIMQLIEEVEVKISRIKLGLYLLREK